MERANRYEILVLHRKTAGRVGENEQKEKSSMGKECKGARGYWTQNAGLNRWEWTNYQNGWVLQAEVHSNNKLLCA